MLPTEPKVGWLSPDNPTELAIALTENFGTYSGSGQPGFAGLRATERRPVLPAIRSGSGRGRWHVAPAGLCIRAGNRHCR